MTRATFTIAIALLPSMTNWQIKDIIKISARVRVCSGIFPEGNFLMLTSNSRKRALPLFSKGSCVATLLRGISNDPLEGHIEPYVPRR